LCLKHYKLLKIQQVFPLGGGRCSLLHLKCQQASSQIGVLHQHAAPQSQTSKLPIPMLQSNPTSIVDFTFKGKKGGDNTAITQKIAQHIFHCLQTQKHSKCMVLLGGKKTLNQRTGGLELRFSLKP